MHNSNYKKPLAAEFGSIRLIGSYWNKGFVISRYRKLTRLKSYEGVLLSGPTGSGKTSRFLIKNCLSLKNCSLLINNPQGEFTDISGYLSKYFKHIHFINFSDSERSVGYNPFSRIKKANDVNKLARLLISNTLEKGSGDIFWSLSATNLAQVLIRILRYQPQEYHNLANLIRLLHYFAVEPQKVDGWVAKSNDEQLLIDYKSILAIPPKTLDNIVASVKAALQIFDDPEIKRTTAFDMIDFELMRKEPTAIILNNTIGDQKYISTLNAILFDQFYTFALDKPPLKTDLGIFVVLEECASMYIPSLAQATATSRKAKVGNLLVVQCHNQLKSLYKDEAETIKANCRTKIWLTGQTSIDELREIETLGGKRIFKDLKNTERTISLISSDAIRMLPENRSLILSGNHPLILAKSSQAHRSLIYRPRLNVPPVTMTQHIPDTPILMLK